ncbi:MAG: hypothetical protein LR017_01475 [Candidatus Pacebacteria bacterium]|nr:hypothetical protein [Candidatus Paceibacterota bacterium]
MVVDGVERYTETMSEDAGMSEYLEIHGTQYVPVSVAAKKFGYTSDYLTKLAREKRIAASKINGRWFVSLDSVEDTVVQLENNKVRTSKQTSIERKRVFAAQPMPVYEATASLHTKVGTQKRHALAQATIIALIGVLFGLGGYTMSNSQVALVAHADWGFFEQVAVRWYTFISKDRRIAHQPTVVSHEYERVGQVSTHTETPTPHPHAVVATTTNTGVLVMSPHMDVQTMEQLDALRNSFSDDVHIIFDSKDMQQGALVPEFKDATGDAYQFILVPVPATETQ